MQIGQKIYCAGHCHGIIPDGAEIAGCTESTYSTVNNGSLCAGFRPKKGYRYTLNGEPVQCVQSAFSEGDADYPDTWTFTLEKA